MGKTMPKGSPAQEPNSLHEIIRGKLGDVERQDYFGVLGIAADANPQAVQSAYFTLAKQLHPDRLVRAGLADEEAKDARRVFEFVTEAFRVLSDATKREEYLHARRSGLANPFSTANTASKMAGEEAKILAHKGKKMLKMRAWSDAETFLRRAIEKVPDSADYLTSLGWAVFNNTDRAEAQRGEEAKRLWNQALELERKLPFAHYYLSLYYKAAGDTGKQKRSLESALDLKSNLIEAQREMRLLEMRAGSAKKSGKGLLHAIFPSLAARRSNKKKRR